MSDEGEAIRRIAALMKQQVAKVNIAAATDTRKKAVYGAMGRTRRTGGKSVTVVKRRPGVQ